MWHERARDAYRILVGKREVKRLLGKYDDDGGIILTRIFKKRSVPRAWTGLIWLRTVTSGRLLWTR